jgi:hypothetical protein
MLNSSRGRPAPISRSAGRAGQTTLNTTTPSGLSHDKGVRFHLCARQGFKKSAKKLLKTKNDQNDEKGHQRHDCCHRCCSEKSGGETGNAVGLKNALAKFLVIFTLKRSRLSSQDWLLYRDDAAVRATLRPRLQKAAKVLGRSATCFDV